MKNLLKLSGAQQLSKQQQLNIAGKGVAKIPLCNSNLQCIVWTQNTKCQCTSFGICIGTFNNGTCLK